RSAACGLTRDDRRALPFWVARRDVSQNAGKATRRPGQAVLDKSIEPLLSPRTGPQATSPPVARDCWRDEAAESSRAARRVLTGSRGRVESGVLHDFVDDAFFDWAVFEFLPLFLLGDFDPCCLPG